MVSVVQKQFEGPNGVIAVGTVVETSAWRNEARLHGSRYLRPATDVEIADLVEDGAGPRPTTSKVPASRPSAKSSGRKRT